MRNPNRLYRFYEELRTIHMEKVPDLRFGQMMSNIFAKMQLEGRDPFFPEEREMMDYIKKYFDMEVSNEEK